MTHFIDDFPGRNIKTDKGEFLYFGGTAYLGLQTNKDFQELFIKNIRKYGTNYGASRKSNVRFSLYGEAENYLAHLVGSEACVTLSSGYMASQLVSQFFNGNKFAVYVAPHTHESLLQTSLLPYKTYAGLKKDIEKNTLGTTPVILLDSIDFMGINYPDFEGLKSLPLKKCIVIADDSHGLGILGKKGEGIYKQLQALNAKELVVCGSLGKGFGVQCGAIFGTKQRIDQLTKTAFFGGASPAGPATLATLIESPPILNAQRENLNNNLIFFKSLLADNNLFMHIGQHPTFTFMDEGLTKHLYENNILVTSFNYPKEDSPLMSRIVISAFHTKKDIETLAEAINLYA
ncbi:aminotransferase class I/II-fold pyridoxal phosphate-dependent enzyme [Galbibacter sp. PAP.153]|uniref:aminotransferase class I/II-fold pyridoxal phosphate-dependent enzyme n=1 Tax=Galbibacter sp. PAP.153 TaxID=3104623 RepID=UPI00300B3D1C